MYNSILAYDKNDKYFKVSKILENFDMDMDMEMDMDFKKTSSCTTSNGVTTCTDSVAPIVVGQTNTNDNTIDSSQSEETEASTTVQTSESQDIDTSAGGCSNYLFFILFLILLIVLQ